MKKRPRIKITIVPSRRFPARKCPKCGTVSVGNWPEFIKKGYCHLPGQRIDKGRGKRTVK